MCASCRAVKTERDKFAPYARYLLGWRGTFKGAIENFDPNLNRNDKISTKSWEYLLGVFRSGGVRFSARFPPATTTTATLLISCTARRLERQREREAARSKKAAAERPAWQ